MTNLAKDKTTEQSNGTIREAVGIFPTHAKLEEAVKELEISGFARDCLSVLGGEKAIKEHYGTIDVSPSEVMDDSHAPRSVKVRKEEVGVAEGALVGGATYVGVAAALLATGGLVAVPSAAILTAAVGGAGGAAIGVTMAKLLGNEYSDFFQRRVDEGGLLLWVKTSTQKDEQEATAILKKHDAEHVHVHDINVSD